MSIQDNKNHTVKNMSTTFASQVLTGMVFTFMYHSL